ncbi:MAG: DctP family TRAP transporter solute-binding subunit [Pseudomonadota bacterium]|nr:DctP family TRAP transporter solute-binding subunit [Pseudomonadota bacterium]
MTFGAAAQEKPLELRMAFLLPLDSYQGAGVTAFIEDVRQASNGRIRVTPQGGGSGGSEAQTIQNAMAGKVEMVVSTTTSIASVLKVMALWDTPLLFANASEAYAMLDGVPGRKVLDALDGVGLVGLSYWENGFRNVTNNVRPITSMGDFKGLRLRVMPTEIATSAFKRLGVDVRPLPWPEVIGAINSNTIDGQENPLTVISSTKLYEIQKYMSLTNHVYSPFAVVASKQWWASLSAEDQKILRDAAEKSRIVQRAAARKAADDAMVIFRNSQMKVNTIDASARASIAYRLERNVAAIAANVGLPLWIETNNMLVEMRAKK